MEKPPRPEADLTAACACGAVTMRFAGPVRSMFMCSCVDCQRATGTGHATVMMASPEDVTITGPTRTFDRSADSGATFTRCFCPQCGTPLWGRSSRAPDALMLPVGFFGAAAAGWYRPNQLIFARSHREWDILAADMPRHQTYREAR